MEFEKNIKIAFLSEFDPLDKKISSGTNFKCAEELKKIGNFKWVPCKKTLFGKLCSRICYYLKKIFKVNYIVRLTNRGSYLSYNIPQTAVLNQFDIIIAFFCIPVLANIKTSTPVIYLSDASFPVLLNYYPDYSAISKRHMKHILDVEKKAYANASKLVFASEWAASGAKKLEVPASKIEIIEYGANLDDKDIELSLELKDGVLSPVLNCLFLGVDWFRKGGQTAIDAINWLNNNGINAHLNIVGCTPPHQHIDQQYISQLGFLDKNKSSDYKSLIKLISSSDLLLLPTIAECAGIVFAEASAYGLPIFTYDTGGISNYVVNGINGYRLPMGSNGSEFGKKIKETIESGGLSTLSEGGKELYKRTLNWTRWRVKIEHVINGIII